MNTVIHWAGDSTVKQNNIKTYPQTGIGQMFHLFLKPDVMVHNHAENGRSTKSFLAEGRFAEIEEIIKENDFLFIQFGHNDEKKDAPLRYAAPFGAYSDNLRFMINAALEHKAYPVLITPLYRRLFQAGTSILTENCHLDYPDAMKAVARETNTPLVDLCNSSFQSIKAAGPEKSREWFLHTPASLYPYFPEGSSDDTHLQPLGAITFGALIADELYRLGGVYRDLLVPLENVESYSSLLW